MKTHWGQFIIGTLIMLFAAGAGIGGWKTIFQHDSVPLSNASTPMPLILSPASSLQPPPPTVSTATPITATQNSTPTQSVKYSNVPSLVVIPRIEHNASSHDREEIAKLVLFNQFHTPNLPESIHLRLYSDLSGSEFIQTLGGPVIGNLAEERLKLAIQLGWKDTELVEEKDYRWINHLENPSAYLPKNASVKPQSHTYFAILTYTPNRGFPKNLDHLDCMHYADAEGHFEITAIRPSVPLLLFSQDKPIVIRLAYHLSVAGEQVQSDYYTLEATTFEGRYPTKTEQQEATPHGVFVNDKGEWLLTHDGHEIVSKKQVVGLPAMSIY